MVTGCNFETSDHFVAFHRSAICISLSIRCGLMTTLLVHLSVLSVVSVGKFEHVVSKSDDDEFFRKNLDKQNLGTKSFSKKIEKYFLKIEIFFSTSSNYTYRTSCRNFKSFRLLHHSVIMWYHTKK